MLAMPDFHGLNPRVLNSRGLNPHGLNPHILKRPAALLISAGSVKR